jgi:hypothetical protein
MSGMSKKLCITMIGIQAIVHLSQDAPDKLWYAGLVASVVIFYKLVQCRIDVIRSKFGIQDKEER